MDRSLLARWTETGQFENVVFDDEAGLALELIHKRLEVLRAWKLDDVLAVFTDQMVAVVVFGQRVAVAAVLGVHTSGDAQLGEQRQRAVDGDEPQFRRLAFCALMDGFGAQPAIALGEGVYDGAAGVCQAVPALAQLLERVLNERIVALIESIFH